MQTIILSILGNKIREQNDFHCRLQMPWNGLMGFIFIYLRNASLLCKNLSSWFFLDLVLSLECSGVWYFLPWISREEKFKLPITSNAYRQGKIYHCEVSSAENFSFNRFFSSDLYCVAFNSLANVHILWGKFIMKL